MDLGMGIAMLFLFVFFILAPISLAGLMIEGFTGDDDKEKKKKDDTGSKIGSTAKSALNSVKADIQKHTRKI